MGAAKRISSGDESLVEVIKGKYRLVREIARSNDIVYEAQDTALGRRIALKELNIAPSLTGQARRERIERFNREARAAGRLSHPNIVSVFDYGEDSGRYFIAMEFLEGQSLRDVLQVRGALPLKEALTIAGQVLDALSYAHANRVIHRDIKPDNIHILPGGQVKLTDFGIARLTEEAALTGDGQIFGTPSYMSPEQIIGRGIDYRSDLFSLAVVLYEMLAGRKPFVGDSVVSITYAVMHAPPPPLPGVPPAIEEVLYRALAKDPNGRYSSAEQMKRELLEAETRPITFMPTPSTSYGPRTGRGFGYHNTGVPVPPPFQVPGGYSGGNTNYGGALQGGYAPASPSFPDPSAGPVPWNWNNSPASSGSAPLSAHPAPNAQRPTPNTPLGSSGHLPQGAYPYGPPPFQRPPAGPVFEMSPGTRTLLLTILIGAVLGGSIAGGIVAFLHSYDQYRVNVATQHVTDLMAKGVAAYNNQDYTAAANWFQKALSANPGASDREKIVYNLAATDIQAARTAKARGDLNGARQAYQQALAIAPDNQMAHTELAAILDRLGDSSGAKQERAAAQDSGSTQDAPQQLKPFVSSGNANTEGAQQFVDDRRTKAQSLIQEGDALAAQGDLMGARDKWEEAISAAPGTPERDAAKQRLDHSESVPNFRGAGGGGDGGE
jgi:serine/threonine-protein kinase